jgi:hypothetical protein
VTQPRLDDRVLSEAGEERFSSEILPRYLRRVPSVDNLIPILYLKGVSSGDMSEALASILGSDAAGLSATNVVRLKAQWEQDYQEWCRRDLKGLLRQSFMTAANAFAAIDAPTRGVIVQHGDEGKRLVGELAAARDISKQFDLLRACQQYSVNVFPHQLKQLEKEGAVHEVQSGTGILYVDQEYYSRNFGLSTSAEEAQTATMV